MRWADPVVWLLLVCALAGVAVLLRRPDLAPWAVLGLLAGALAVVAGLAAPRPSRAYLCAALVRSPTVAVCWSQLHLGWGRTEGEVMFVTLIIAYVAEHLLTGAAVLGSQFATRPLATWRAARGLATPEDRP